MSSRVVHFEVPYDDAERARGFYADVFGWQIQPIPELSYDIVSTGPVGDQGMPTEPGFIGGGMTQRERHGAAAGDHDRGRRTSTRRSTRMRANGGSAVGDKVPVADMGTAAYFQDSEGNLMGLWQNAT